MSSYDSDMGDINPFEDGYEEPDIEEVEECGDDSLDDDD